MHVYKNQSGYVKPLLIIVLLLGLLGGIVYVRNKQQPQQSDGGSLSNQTESATSSEPSPKSKPILQIDEKVSTYSGELRISFDYPAGLDLSQEYRASQGKYGANLGEEWLFRTNKASLESGSFVISASSSKYNPQYWEGGPLWFNSKVSPDAPPELVKKEMQKGDFRVLEVESVKSLQGLSAFKSWALSCHGWCALERIYIVPLDNSKYNNLIIFTVLEEFNEKIRVLDNVKLAEDVINKIERDQADPVTLSYKRGQDIIFNSIKFD